VNLKEYISSGIIESCVLGLATEAEQQELAALCLQHPEVAQARDEFERALEQQLVQDALTPPAFLKQQIDQQLFPPQIGKPVRKRQLTPVRDLHIWQWVAAAAILLLVGTAIWAIVLFSQNRKLQQANHQLQQQADVASGQLAQLQKDSEMLLRPTVRMASLQPMPAAPAAAAKVFWDTTSKDVYLLINNLPQPASDKQYQLWAMLNNQPVDLGVFDIRQNKLMVRMKNVQNAQAFAITLEPKGGSPVPTGDMYVLGKL